MFATENASLALTWEASYMFTLRGGCDNFIQMPVYFRLIFAFAATLLLSNCGLIGTALRLAPYALMLADENGKGAAAGKTSEMRGREVQDKKARGIPPADVGIGSHLAFKH